MIVDSRIQACPPTKEQRLFWEVKDYKFFCFNGKPEIMFIATDRATDVKFDFFDMDFNHLDITTFIRNQGMLLKSLRNLKK